MQPYRPEGTDVQLPCPEDLRRGLSTGEVFQAKCIKCDEFQNLHLDLGSMRGLIPKEEASLELAEGKIHPLSMVSRVGKYVSFQVLGFDQHGTLIASRKAAQEEARSYFLSALRPGDVIPAVVRNPADFGVFCDIGCGFTALMRIDRCCVSRLSSTAQRYRTGQLIYAAILSADDALGQLNLTGRELLGTWEENASLFRPGQTVTGIVRSVMSYGTFVELTPNLSGLAETTLELQPGECVSVYIRSILPDKHKIKLNIVERLLPDGHRPPLVFYHTGGHLDFWEYYPGSKAVTYF